MYKVYRISPWELCKRLFLGLCVVVSLSGQGHCVAAASTQSETVILLHGILLNTLVMKRIEWSLQREGYKTINWEYPSTKKTIEEHAADLNRMVGGLKVNGKLHFVGFSLGALVIRYYLTHYTVPNVGRFVMIGPPNHGSEAADNLYRHAWFRWIYGNKAMPQLRSSNQQFYAQLPQPPCEFGIIAGVKGDGHGYGKELPGDDDSTVSLESARLEGAKDMVTVRHQHTMMLFAKDVIFQVIHFIQRGEFSHQHP